jgi:hypothetical protein
LSHAEDLKGDPILNRDDSNNNVRNVLIPHKIELWDIEGNILLLMRDTVLGAESTTRPTIDL